MFRERQAKRMYHQKPILKCLKEDLKAEEKYQKKKSLNIGKEEETIEKVCENTLQLPFPHQFSKVSLIVEAKIITLSGVVPIICKYLRQL